MAQIAAQQLQEIGLDVNANVPSDGIDWGGQECCIIGWGSPFDADDHTYKVFGTDAGANYSGYYAYMIRNKLLEETRADYVLLGKSKGLDKKQIMFGHCLRNIMPTYISIMAISVPHVLGGTYIVEKVFSYPGIGTLSFESAQYHDYNLLMVLCMMTGILVIFCNLLGQIINERIDPRIKANEVVETSEVSKV